MSFEGLLHLPYRGGFASDEAKHQANIRALETWALGPKPWWALQDLTTLPAVGDFEDGAQVFVADVLYVRSAGVWKAVQADVVATASLPAAGTSQNGRILIEDAGAGDRNLVIYAGGQRFRIDGGAAF